MQREPKTSVEDSFLLYIPVLPLGFECSQSSEILLRLLVSILKGFLALDFLLNRRDSWVTGRGTGCLLLYAAAMTARRSPGSSLL